MEPVTRQHGLRREAEITPLARVQDVDGDLARPEAPGEEDGRVLARAAQQARVRRAVAGILEGNRCAARPLFAVELPGCLEAVDTRPGDIPILALEGVGVDHDEVDQLVDVIAKRRE